MRRFSTCQLIYLLVPALAVLSGTGCQRTPQANPGTSTWWVWLLVVLAVLLLVAAVVYWLSLWRRRQRYRERRRARRLRRMGGEPVKPSVSAARPVDDDQFLRSLLEEER